jgi:hypothetical protein
LAGVERWFTDLLRTPHTEHADWMLQGAEDPVGEGEGREVGKRLGSACDLESGIYDAWMQRKSEPLDPYDSEGYRVMYLPKEGGFEKRINGRQLDFSA